MSFGLTDSSTNWPTRIVEERAVARSVERQSATEPSRGPLRVQWMRLPTKLCAADFGSVVFAVHAKAVARNLDCVLTSVNPEGPHQLRVSLRRLRVVLRAFGPVMRTTVAEHVARTARRIGSIVSELRDADVLIDELIGPSASRYDATKLMKPLDNWRQEVRGRVRARLLGATVPEFAHHLVDLSGTFTWCKRKRRQHMSADLVTPFVARSARRVAEAVARLPQLAHEEVHDVRKEVKALRYAVELADALSLNRDIDLPHCLKRAQDALGYVNDMSLLESFSPPLAGENAAFAQLRARLVADRADMVASNLSNAASWLENIEDRCSKLDLPQTP